MYLQKFVCILYNALEVAKNEIQNYISLCYLLNHALNSSNKALHQCFHQNNLGLFFVWLNNI